MVTRDIARKNKREEAKEENEQREKKDTTPGRR